MKKLVLAISTTVLLAACGEDPSQVLMDDCMAEGEATKADCTCIVNATVNNLDDADVNKLAEAIKSGNDTEEFMGELMKDWGTDAGKMKSAGKMADDILTCATEAIERQ